MKITKILPTLLARTAAVALTALLMHQPLVIAADVAPGQPAPAWELKDVDGKTVKSTDFANKVVVLDFWATWCPPCRKGIPGFVELQKQYEKQGLVVVGISLDREGTKVVKEFMAKHNVNYPIVMGDDAIADTFGGIEGIPTAFIIDRKGRIVSRHVGFAPKETFEAEIKPLLGL